MSTTTIRFEHFAGMSAAHLSSDDGGYAFVFCSIPGGTPRFQFDPKSTESTRVVNASACSTHAEFKQFVEQRFGDSSSTTTPTTKEG